MWPTVGTVFCVQLFASLLVGLPAAFLDDQNNRVVYTLVVGGLTVLVLSILYRAVVVRTVSRAVAALRRELPSRDPFGHTDSPCVGGLPAPPRVFGSAFHHEIAKLQGTSAATADAHARGVRALLKATQPAPPASAAAAPTSPRSVLQQNKRPASDHAPPPAAMPDEQRMERRPSVAVSDRTDFTAGMQSCVSSDCHQGGQVDEPDDLHIDSDRGSQAGTEATPATQLSAAPPRRPQRPAGMPLIRRGARFPGDTPNTAIYIARSKNENLVVYVAKVQDEPFDFAKNQSRPTGGAFMVGKPPLVLPAKDPIDAHWLRLQPKEIAKNRAKGKLDDCKPLSSLEWRLAYGVNTKQTTAAATPPRDRVFDVRFVALPKLQLTLQMMSAWDVGTGSTVWSPVIYVNIHGRQCAADRVYVCSRDTAMLPTVEYVDVLGNDVETGEFVEERLKP